jgi:hypothetical protein
MEQFKSHMRALAVFAACVTLPAIATATAIAQRPVGTVAPVIDKRAVVEPTATVADATPTPTLTPTATPTVDPTASPGASPTPAPAPAPGSRAAVIHPGYGNAATQSDKAKKREAKRACTSTRPPTSHMLAVPGIASGRDGGSFVPIGVAIVVGTVLFAGGAALLRRHGRGDAPAPQQGALERFAAVLGVCGIVATLLLQLAPDLTAHPPPAATFAIKKVHQRIERGDYAKSLGADVKLSRLDAREVGNVVWLDIQLTGFKHRPLRVKYGLYDLDRAAGGALLPGTAKDVGLLEPKRNSERYIVPIWVGYPKSAKFSAEFWLLDGGGLQEMASTGSMRGSAYRYACEVHTA